MIKFTERHVKPILDGMKIETRRSWPTVKFKVGSIQSATVEEGEGKTKKAVEFAKLEILKIDTQVLQRFNRENARAEGFSSVAEFVQDWRARTKGWDPTEEVKVIRFRVSHS